MKGKNMTTKTVPKQERTGSEGVFKDLAKAVQPYIETSTLDEGRVVEIVDDRVSKIVPRPVEVNINDKTAKLEGFVHAAFDAIMQIVSEGCKNVYLYGPAGTGKTTLAANVASALSAKFSFISLSMGVTETHLFGRLLPQEDGSWQYTKSAFVEIYENGGVFLLDEFDAADANVMVSINAALANGMFANPVSGRVHHRSEDTYIIAAANTWGHGADAQYVGRNQLDTATLDRFTMAKVHVKYDETLESQIANSRISSEAKCKELLDWVKELRESISELRLKRVATTRLVERAANAIAAGRSLPDVKARYFCDWSHDERRRVLCGGD